MENSIFGKKISDFGTKNRKKFPKLETRIFFSGFGIEFLEFFFRLLMLKPEFFFFGLDSFGNNVGVWIFFKFYLFFEYK